MRELVVAAVLLACAPPVCAFDLSNSRVPQAEILSGGPPKDGIPAILSPKLVPASKASFLDDADRVVGVAGDGEAKAYPLRILNWHEVVNDSLGRRPVAVTYCPLTASAVIFERAVGGRTLTFGVSGLLFQSNVLLYDHQSESLWSQLGGVAVAGASADTTLGAVASVETTWKTWRTAHPGTLVLSPETGFTRDYDRDPYADYHRASYAMFETRAPDARLAMKAKVVGLALGQESVAYPLERLADHSSVEDRVGGVPVRIVYDSVAQAASVERTDSGAQVPAVAVYWFAWTAFHPETRLWDGVKSSAGRHPPDGEAYGNADVAVTSHTAYWADLPLVSLDAKDGEMPGLLVIRGELANRSGHSLHHVKLRHELLDAGGRVVAAEDGFSLLGESLQISPDLDGAVRQRDDSRPLPPRGTDSFRMLFVGSELPSFERYRVRVLEPPPAGVADRPTTAGRRGASSAQR